MSGEVNDKGVHFKLIEFEGKPAIEFDDGDICFQTEPIGEFLRCLSILMPNCELPDDLVITGEVK